MKKVRLARVIKIILFEISHNAMFWGFLGVLALCTIFTEVVLNGREVADYWTLNGIIILCFTIFFPIVMYRRYYDTYKIIYENTVFTNVNEYSNFEITKHICFVVCYLLILFLVQLYAYISLKGNIYSYSFILADVLIIFISYTICVACMEMVKKYNIGVLVYYILIGFFIMITNPYLSFLPPVDIEMYGKSYFIGKSLELVVVSVFAIITEKKYKS